MDFGKAFTYVFDDEEWIKKILIGALLSLIPFVGWWFVGGWGLEITKNVIRREEKPLAEWDDLGGYLVRGFQVMLVGVVYALPIILFSLCISLLPVVGVDPSAGDNTMASIYWVVMVCFSCVSILYGIILALVVPAALGNMAAAEQFGAAFRFGEVFGMVRSAFGAYVIVILGTLVAGLVAGLGILLCVVGVLLTTVWANAVNSHLYGQAYNVAQESQSLETAI